MWLCPSSLPVSFPCISSHRISSFPPSLSITIPISPPPPPPPPLCSYYVFIFTPHHFTPFKPFSPSVVHKTQKPFSPSIIHIILPFRLITLHRLCPCPSLYKPHPIVHVYAYFAASSDSESSSDPSFKVGHPSPPQCLRVCLEHAGPRRGDHLKTEPPLLVVGHLDRADTQVFHHNCQLLQQEDRSENSIFKIYDIYLASDTSV